MIVALLACIVTPQGDSGLFPGKDDQQSATPWPLQTFIYSLLQIKFNSE